MTTPDVEKTDSHFPRLPTSRFSFLDTLTLRIKRRPARYVMKAASFAGVLICMWIVWLALNPHLIFTNTTPTGGDMGAHVWWPAFMRDFLLPNGRIFGWTMDNYSGFPVGQYYFPVPAIFIVILDILLPYNVAFKLIAAAGSVALPLAAYTLGRGIKAPRPIPVLMAFAATVFLFFSGDPRTSDTPINYKNANFNHHIMGGPIMSSMAGEFSFVIALAFALFFLAAFAVMLREGKHRARVAVLFALTVMSHLVVAIFLGIALVIFWGASYVAKKGIYRPLGSVLIAWVVLFGFCIGSIGRYFFDKKFEIPVFFVLGATVALVGVVFYGLIRHRRDMLKVACDAFPVFVGVLLSSVWLIPLLTRFDYTSNMRYEKLVDVVSTAGVNEIYELYISPSYFLWPVFIPAAIGFILSATLLRKNIVPILVTALVMGVVFIQWPEGHAWNLRFLPFWYLFIFFMAATGYGEIIRLPSAILSRIAFVEKKRVYYRSFQWVRALSIVAVVGLCWVMLVGVGPIPRAPNGCPGIDNRTFPDRRGFGSSWARYNFEGYERKPQPGCGDTSPPRYASSKEYKNLMDAMARLPEGRALWETETTGYYGTTLALALLPYFTDHRIASQEGLYYEAGGSTAYHFLTVAEVSERPSNPMRWPLCKQGVVPKKKDASCVVSDYGSIVDFRRGVEHMQMMGVRYYMAHSQQAINAASTDPDLALVRQVQDVDGLDPKGWNIYRVAQSDVVAPLVQTPTVITDKKEPSDWAQSGNVWLHAWFNGVNIYPYFVNDGPSSWKHQTAEQALNDPLDETQEQKTTDVKVSNIELTQDSVSFHVNKTGTPILVKVSYYPTFRVTGAAHIYRASPNFMVVVPTSHDVKITLERDGIEWVSIFLFVSGIVLATGLAFSHKLSSRRYFRFLSKKEDSKL